MINNGNVARPSCLQACGVVAMTITTAVFGLPADASNGAVYIGRLSAHAASLKEQHSESQADSSAYQGETTVPEKYRSESALRERDEQERAMGYRFGKLVRGNKERKLIALTFDDGPHPIYTLKLLEVLKEAHVHATFFVVGKQVDKYPALVQLEVMQGHEIGNHTYDHVDLTQIPPELIGYELDECNRAIKRATGTTAHFFRPPGGDYDVDVVREATRRSIVTTLWTDDPGDYAKPGADIVLQRTLDRLENGAIILLHDGIPETVDILPALIAEARKRGYEFVTISELAKD